jgi:hypothetical protein
VNRIRQYAPSRPPSHAESATIFSGHRLLQRKRARGASDQIGERAEYPNKGFPTQPRATNPDAESRNDCFVPPIVHDVVRSPGRPLDPATRGFMEPRFGHDFSHVRIHTDSKAAESARTLNARAYTVGNAVVFGSGRFAPSTSAGRLLIAHELSHTIQQSSPEIPLTGELTTMPSDHPTERRADAAAQLVSAGGSAKYLFQGHTRTFSSGKTPALQLQPEAKAPAPAPKSFREKLDGFIAQKNALRSQLDTNARSLQFMTTVVGIYSNDVFKQWEPWRKGILKIGDAALGLKQEIEKTIVDDKVMDQPGGQKLEEEALTVAESARFILIDATRTVVPVSTTVSVIERVDTVTFVTSGVVKGKSLELQEWLDKIKADYESASRAAKGNKPGSSGSQPPDSGTGTAR